MTKKEKHIVLVALVSEIRYVDLCLKARGCRINLESEQVKDIKNTFLKLNNQFFKNDKVVLNANNEYLEMILEEIKNGGIKK